MFSTTLTREGPPVTPLACICTKKVPQNTMLRTSRERKMQRRMPPCTPVASHPRAKPLTTASTAASSLSPSRVCKLGQNRSSAYLRVCIHACV